MTWAHQPPWLAAGCAAVTAALTLANTAAAHATAANAVIDVPAGASIQDALGRAGPGTRIRLTPGADYREQVRTVTAGTADAPIVLDGRGATITAPGKGRVLTIDHPGIHVRDLVIHGQPGIAPGSYPPGPSPDQAREWKDAQQPQVVDSQLIYVGDHATGVQDVTIENITGYGAGAECVRVRNAATGVTIRGIALSWCGMLAKDTRAGRDRYRNGEGVYVGTSPKSTTQPMPGRDTTERVTVTGSIIATYGSECFEVKEQASGNVFEGNWCGLNIVPGGALVSVRGPGNTVTGNVFGANASGTVVKVAADPGYDASGNVIQYAEGGGSRDE